MMTYLQALQARRSNYDLSATSSLSDHELEQLLADALLLSPTGFNSQSGRIVLLLKEKHELFWDLVIQAIEKEIGNTPAFAQSQAKITKLRNSYGTILFYEDEEVNEQLKARFPLYANNIATWSEQSQGMLQMSVWTLLAAHGMGASLQHYTELVAEPLKQKLGINPSWRLIGQMPFGVPNTPAPSKDKIPGHQRLVVLR